MAKDDEDLGFKRWVECDGNLSDSLDACTLAFSDRWPPIFQTARVLRVLEVSSSLDQRCHHEVAGAIAAQDQPLLSM
ncbi:uncharacterized protein RAG0_06644 [Rhynchosporium agropyri]|uniref:Uncharacterized protein n=1 Tax=Rhynchosporium agropyri TaxID=914238 RepID=A0A1E1KI91_9HELO|nr:uncharacterized protein RAG0_06644 [Rhynchosporium agropyri]